MKISYRPFEKKDLILHHRWFNHPEVRKFLGPEVRNGSTLAYHQKWFKDNIVSGRSRMFVILADETPIGVVGLNDISFDVDQNGGVHLVIGEPNFWHEGIGTKAMEFIIDYAFKELKLHKVFLVVAQANKAAIKCYEKLGFKKEGILQDQTFIGGEFQDEIWMGLIISKF